VCPLLGLANLLALNDYQHNTGKLVGWTKGCETSKKASAQRAVNCPYFALSCQAFFVFFSIIFIHSYRHQGMLLLI
jgi:hypothetical protein